MPTPPSVRVCSASYRGPLRASDSMPDCPILRLNTGMMSRASTTTATAVATTRCLTTSRAHADQPRDAVPSLRMRG